MAVIAGGGVVQGGGQRDALAPVIAPLLIQGAFGVLPCGRCDPQGGEQVGPVQVEGDMDGFGVGERGLDGGVVGERGNAEGDEGQRGPPARPEQPQGRQGGDRHGGGEADRCVERVTAIIDEGPALLGQDRVEAGPGDHRVEAVGPSGGVLHGGQHVSQAGGLQEVVGQGKPAAQLVPGRACPLDRLAGQVRARGQVRCPGQAVPAVLLPLPGPGGSQPARPRSLGQVHQGELERLQDHGEQGDGQGHHDDLARAQVRGGGPRGGEPDPVLGAADPGRGPGPDQQQQEQRGRIGGQVADEVEPAAGTGGGLPGRGIEVHCRSSIRPWGSSVEPAHTGRSRSS